MAVDPSQTKSARKVRNKPAPWPDKIITHSEIEPEIMVLDPAEDRLCDCANIELIVAAQPNVALHDSPSNTRGYEFRADLVILWRIDRAEQISRLDCQLKSLGIEYVRRCFDAWLFTAAEGLRTCENRKGSESTERFHSARLR